MAEPRHEALGDVCHAENRLGGAAGQRTRLSPPAPTHLTTPYRPLPPENCAASVESASAVVEEVPPEMVALTRSK